MSCNYLKNVFSIGFFGLVFLLLAYSLGYPQDVTKGKKVYETRCLPCHGPEGNPVIPGIPVFSKGESLDKDKAELIKSIKEGSIPEPPTPPMPPMQGQLSEVVHILPSSCCIDPIRNTLFQVFLQCGEQLRDLDQALRPTT